MYIDLFKLKIRQFETIWDIKRYCEIIRDAQRMRNWVKFRKNASLKKIDDLIQKKLLIFWQKMFVLAFLNFLQNEKRKYNLMFLQLYQNCRIFLFLISFVFHCLFFQKEIMEKIWQNNSNSGFLNENGEENWNNPNLICDQKLFVESLISFSRFVPFIFPNIRNIFLLIFLTNSRKRSFANFFYNN